MFLFHATDLENLLNILNDTELKSNKLTKIVNYGDQLYDTNGYVYFGTCPELFNKKISGSCVLYFNSDLLYNRKFYLCTHWTSHPNEIFENKPENKYGREYPRYFDKINVVLKKLYKNSTDKPVKASAFKVFQQVAIKNKCNIKNNLVAICIKKTNKFLSLKLINKIKKIINDKYLNVEIKFIK